MATSEASFVASLVAMCAAYRSVSWKVLLSAGLVYGTAYAAERLMWTNRDPFQLQNVGLKILHTHRKIKRLVLRNVT